VETKVLFFAFRGLNAAALLRLEPPGDSQLTPVFVCYFRVSYAEGARIEEWSRVAPHYEDAAELYQRGVQDFIDPVPFIPASPAHEPTWADVPEGDRPAQIVVLSPGTAEKVTS
jgi:hypothetical protein